MQLIAKKELLTAEHLLLTLFINLRSLTTVTLKKRKIQLTKGTLHSYL